MASQLPTHVTALAAQPANDIPLQTLDQAYFFLFFHHQSRLDCIVFSGIYERFGEHAIARTKI